MFSIQNPWEFVAKQKERFLLIASLVSLGTGVLNSLLDKANPPLMTLSIFSILVLAACLWMTFARTTDRKRKYSLSETLGLWIGSIFLLAVAWSFIYREHLEYSKIADQLVGGQRIIVSDAIAWEVLQYTTPAGETSSTVVGELASLLSHLHYRPVVFKQADLASYEPTKHDGFILSGVAERLGVVLNATMIITKPRAERLIQQVENDVEITRPADKGDAPLLVLPNKRFLRNQFLFSHFTIDAPLSPEATSMHRTTVARLVMRYALATMLHYDGSSDAPRLFRDILTIGDLLPSIKNEPLSRIYKGTAYYLAAYAQNINEALRALELAGSLAPLDSEVNVMRSYLLLSSKRSGEAKGILDKLRSNRDDPALYHELLGQYAVSTKEYDDAIEEWTMALQFERDDNYRYFLHLGIAMCYGMANNVKDQVRSAEMIKHTEDAIQLRPNKVGYLYVSGICLGTARKFRYVQKSL